MKSHLTKVLFEFVDWLGDLKIPYALIGGLAVGYWAEERFTKDIDFTIILDDANWDKLRKSFDENPKVKINKIANDADSSLPYLIRISYADCPVDLIVSLTEFQESLLSRSREVSVGNETLRIAMPEDIIISKLIAARSQDLADIEKIVQTVSDLDIDYIDKWAKVWEVEQLWLKMKKS